MLPQAAFGALAKFVAKTNVIFRFHAKHNNIPEVVSVAQSANDFGRGNEVITILRASERTQIHHPRIQSARQWAGCPRRPLINLKIKPLGVHFQKIDLFRQFASISRVTR